MQSQEYRFRAGQITSEVFSLILIGFLSFAFVACIDVWGYAQNLPRELVPAFLWAGPALAVAGLLGGLLFRWRSRLRLGPDGVERRRSASHVVTRLAWEEIDELFLLGPSEFELRGAGKRIRFSDHYDRVERAREHCREGLSDLRTRLRDRALRDGELVFRVPGSRLKGHVIYLAVILVLTGLTGLVLLWFVKAVRMGLPFIFVFFGGRWLWGLRRRASRLGTRVILYKDGLRVGQLDRQAKVAWSDLQGTDWTEWGELVLLLRSGQKILLPATLSNIALLEELIEEGRQVGQKT